MQYLRYMYVFVLHLFVFAYVCVLCVLCDAMMFVCVWGGVGIMP